MAVLSCGQPSTGNAMSAFTYLQSFAAVECGLARVAGDVTSINVCLRKDTCTALVGSCSCKLTTLNRRHHLSDYTHGRY